VTELNARYSDWPEHHRSNEGCSSIPKEKIVELFDYVETGAITEKEFCEMATEIIERAVTRSTA
jgi:hypothetical protein